MHTSELQANLRNDMRGDDERLREGRATRGYRVTDDESRSIESGLHNPLAVVIPRVILGEPWDRSGPGVNVNLEMCQQ